MSNTTLASDDYETFPFAPYGVAAQTIHGIELGVLTVLALITVPLILWRGNMQPLKAFNGTFQLFYVMTIFLDVAYLNIFVLVGAERFPCWLDMLFQLVFGYGYLVLASYRVARMVFIILSVSTKLKLLAHLSPTQQATLKRKAKIFDFLASWKAGVLYCALWFIIFVIQFSIIMGLMVVPDWDPQRPEAGCKFYRVPGDKGIYIAYVPQMILVAAHAFVMIGFTVAMVALRVRDNFGVVLGIVFCSIMLLVAGIYFIVMQNLETAVLEIFLYDMNVMHAVNLFILGMILDMFVNCTIPAIRTFFFDRRRSGISFRKMGVEEAKQAITEIEYFFTNEKGKQLLKDYATKELSVENIMFYEYALEYQNKTTEQERREFAQVIVDQFLMPDSTMAVNIPNSVSSIVRQAMSQSSPLDSDLFLNCMQSAKQNCVDTFARFKKTQEYKRFVAQSQVLLEEQGKLAVQITDNSLSSVKTQTQTLTATSVSPTSPTTPTN